MIKSTGNERCSACHREFYAGQDMYEGHGGTLYHWEIECYIESDDPMVVR